MKKQKKINFNMKFYINVTLIAILVTVFYFLFANHFVLDFYLNGFSNITNCDLQVYFLDVGQASASLIVFPNGKSMIIDCGSKNSEEKFVSDVGFILSKNHLKNIDYLLLTHSDEDHIGGTVKLLEEFDVSKIFRPKLMSTSLLEEENTGGYKTIYTDAYAGAITAVQEETAEVEFVQDMTFSEGESVVTIYSCQNVTSNDSNYYSPFVHVQYAEKAFLFTGDATSARERELISQAPDLHVDFLQVAHHGSNYSTTDTFLSAIGAHYAFISAGDQTHPSEEVLGRLQDHGIEEVYISKFIGLSAVGIGVSGEFFINAMFDYFDYPLCLVLFSIFILTLMNLNINSNAKKLRFRRITFEKLQI